MLLRELTISNERKIAKINRVLKETYGFTLNSDVEVPKIVALQEKIAAELHALKMNQVTAKDSRYVKAVLVQEGLGMLVKRMYESSVAPVTGPGAQAFQRVLSWLGDYVRNACEVGDDHDEAVYEAMKQYRSSKYRFDDALVEFELRKATADCGTPAAPQEPDIEMALGGAAYNDVMGYNDGPQEPMYENEEEFEEPASNICPDCVGAKDKVDPNCKRCDGAGEVYESKVMEKAPPGMEDWIKSNKAKFKKQYGKRGEEVLYATAWKMHNKE